MGKQNEKDFYKDWLDIPEDHRPPNYYQLLGVPEFESDQEAIRRAALKQYAKAKVYQTSMYYEDCIRILHEISRAKVVLSDPVQKEIYDERLTKPSSEAHTVEEHEIAATDAWLAFRREVEPIVQSSGGLNERARREIYAKAEQRGIPWADVAAIVDELEMNWQQDANRVETPAHAAKDPTRKESDFYRDWLNIPDHQRPPNHYQLLGIRDLEDDHEIIKAAALERSAKVEQYLGSEHLEDCVRMLREISQAKAELLDPKAKRDYDKKLAESRPPGETTAKDAHGDAALRSFRREAERIIRSAGGLNESAHSQIYAEAERQGMPLADVASMIEELQLDWPYVRSSQTSQAAPKVGVIGKIRAPRNFHRVLRQLSTVRALGADLRVLTEDLPEPARRALFAFVLLLVILAVIWRLS